MEKALTIAGSDSGGGAGIQQDLKVFTSLGVYGTSVITAVTAQNTRGVQKIFVLPAGIVSEQIDSVLGDIQPDAVKTGMLGSRDIARVVCRRMREYGVEKLVVDPVLESTTGVRLLEKDALPELRRLLPMALLVTPNIREAEFLTGLRINSEEDMIEAAGRIGNCVIKGGHLNARDVLSYGGKTYVLGGRKQNVKLHGAGCTFSAALTAELAKGLDVVEAAKNAKKYTDKAIRNSINVGSGRLKVLNTSWIG